MHMALNEGRRFDKHGLSGQVRRFQAMWEGAPPRKRAPPRLTTRGGTLSTRWTRASRAWPCG